MKQDVGIESGGQTGQEMGRGPVIQSGSEMGTRPSIQGMESGEAPSLAEYGFWVEEDITYIHTEERMDTY